MMKTEAGSLKVPRSPCGTCPYRCDVPSGIWHSSEYAKLVEYDKTTPAQPSGVFLCHGAPDHVCAGWLGCHDKENLLALRVGGHLFKDFDAAAEYVSPVPLFASGAEAAEHGIRDIEYPGDRAKKAWKGIRKKRQDVKVW